MNFHAYLRFRRGYFRGTPEGFDVELCFYYYE